VHWLALSAVLTLTIIPPLMTLTSGIAERGLGKEQEHEGEGEGEGAFADGGAE